MSWKRYFKVIGVVPGPVVWAKMNKKIDLSDDSHDAEFMLELYEQGFPHLELTKEGADVLLGEVQSAECRVQSAECRAKSEELGTDVVENLRKMTVNELVNLIEGSDNILLAKKILEIRPNSKYVKKAVEKFGL